MAFDPLDDGISGVQLIDWLGSDLTVVNAARVSMHKESTWDWEPIDPEDELSLVRATLSEGDRKLIRYLAKHQHWTPFSHPQISLRIKMPIFVARQWFKHQIGITRNEVSRRYVDDTPEVYRPKEWRMRAPNVKQGSSEEVYPGQPYRETARESPNSLVSKMLSMYEHVIAEGICPEQARMLLPQSMYTEFIETGSLAAYARVAKLRLDPHAQLEVRRYAEAVASLIEPHFPVSWKELMQ